MADTGPSAGFMERVFGSKKKKRTEDIHLNTPGEDVDDAIKAGASDYARKKSKPADPEEEDDNKGIFSKVIKTKKKYNPFDKFSKVIGGK